MKQIRLQMLVSGLLVIAAGALLVAFNNEVLPIEYKRIVFSWPMLLVAIGFSWLFGGFRKIFPGAVLMLVGGVFLLRRMDIACTYFTRENVWATVLLVVGGLLVLKAFFFKRFFRFHNYQRRREWQEQYKDCHCHPHHRHHRARPRREFDSANRNSADYIERNCVFGGGREKIESQNFKGGEINCVFGSLQLDLTSAQLAEGENYLEISTVFGGMELYIPADWNVEIRQTNVFGGFVDKRPKVSFEVNENRKLILEIASVFGGGEIKSNA